MPNEIIEVQEEVDVTALKSCLVCELLSYDSNRYSRTQVDTRLLERINDTDFQQEYQDGMRSIAHDSELYVKVVEFRYLEAINHLTNPREIYICASHSFGCFECDKTIITDGRIPYSVRDYFHGPDGDSANYSASAQSLRIVGMLGGSDDRPICRSCVDSNDWTVCEGCSRVDIEDIGYQHINDGDTYICLDCGTNTHFCGTCGTRRFDDDDEHSHDDEYDDDGGSFSSLVHSYSHKPIPIFHQTLAEAQNAEIVHDVTSSWSMPYVRMTHLGFELEVEDKQNNYHAGAEVSLSVNKSDEDTVYLKNDGSLNNGFEIVSHPMTLAWFKENFDTDIFGKLVNLGFRSWNTGTCGLHVHVARDAFMDISHQAKFVHLIMRHPDEWCALAGRTDSRWATFDRELTKKLPEKLKSRTAYDRYTAVNLQNRHTLEVRIFKGSLKVERIMSALEFVDACVEYTRQLTLSNIMTKEGLSVDSFTAWVEQYTEKYPNLLHYLKINGIVDDTDSEEGE